MSIRTALLSALIALGAVACAKPSDVPKLQEEATATVARYAVEVTEIGDRAEHVREAGKRIPDSTPGREQQVAKAEATTQPIGDLQQRIAAAPATIAKDATDEHAVMLLHQFIDNTNGYFEEQLRIVTASLESAEAWQAQQGQIAAAAPPAPVPTMAAPTPPPPPAPADPTSAP